MLENDVAFFIFAIKVVHRLKEKQYRKRITSYLNVFKKSLSISFFQYRYYYGMDIFRASISVLRTRIYSNEFIR